MTKPNLLQFLKHPHYMDILHLISCFDSEGLSAKHLRYALMKKHGLSPPIEKRMQYFFDNNKEKINWLCIPSNSVSNRKNLTHYIMFLHNNDVIKRIGRDKLTRYVLTKKYKFLKKIFPEFELFLKLLEPLKSVKK